MRRERDTESRYSRDEGAWWGRGDWRYSPVGVAGAVPPGREGPGEWEESRGEPSGLSC